MKIKIHPSVANGKVTAPPSKSIAHRALICGALSGGSVVKNVAFSNDVTATIDCLSALGASLNINGNSLNIGGLNIFSPQENAILNCNESGSTLRFLIPLCLVSGKKTTFKGAKRLFERPLSVYESICQEQGILFEKGENELTVCGKLKSGNYRLRGDISSQFISGLLFALPLLDGVSIIEINGNFESESYVDITLAVLNEFGIKITRAGNRFIILGNQRYKSCEFTVEGDCSNAAFLHALNVIGGSIEVGGIPKTRFKATECFLISFGKLKMESVNSTFPTAPTLHLSFLP